MNHLKQISIFRVVYNTGTLMVANIQNLKVDRNSFPVIWSPAILTSQMRKMGWPFFPRNMTGPSPSPKKSGQNRTPKKNTPPHLWGVGMSYYFFNSRERKKRGQQNDIHDLLKFISVFWYSTRPRCWVLLDLLVAEVMGPLTSSMSSAICSTSSKTSSACRFRCTLWQAEMTFKWMDFAIN